MAKSKSRDKKPERRSGFRRLLVIAASLSAVGLAGAGIYRAMSSPLFLVRVVEVSELPAYAPLDSEMILEKAAIPIGKVNLFALDLADIAARIRKNAWIREVRVQKRFPHTLTISPIFHEPKAILQKKDDSLAYVDSGGHVFGKVEPRYRSDLPVLHQVEENMKAALQIVHQWGEADLSSTTELSSIAFDKKRGFSAYVVYPLSKGDQMGRAVIDFGHEIDGDFDLRLNRLQRVFHYLGTQTIAAHQIWADKGKKIVVKIAHGS